MSAILPNTPEAYNLFHEGVLALAEAERQGICIDVPYCEKKISHLTRQMKRLEKKVLHEPEIKIWKKKYRGNFNLQSNDQLEDILFKVLKIPIPKYTEKSQDLKIEDKKGSTDKESLSKVNLPFVKMILEERKLKKTCDNLSGILKEQVNGVLHCFFNLHLVDTYRSSSSNVNFQNFPIRDPIQGKTTRSAFKARKGNILVEFDYGGIEVKGAACYHKDPTMLKYIHDPSKDMHRDMAAQIYKLEDAPAEYWKAKENGGGSIIRYCAKNKYVFPEFYGSYYVECAKNLWDAIDEMSLTDPTGRSLKVHLKEKGIKSYKAFEKHIQAVEKDFWERRFPVYSKWKESWWKKYTKMGYFHTLTGFTCKGVLRKNQVINYPVQGIAFHMLLWSFIQITKEANLRGWISRPVGQIHDSIVMDIHPSEFNEVMRVVNRIMTEDIKEFWDWIIVPLDIEAESTCVDESWHNKKELYPHACNCGIDSCHKIKNPDGFSYRCPVCLSEYIIH